MKQKGAKEALVRPVFKKIILSIALLFVLLSPVFAANKNNSEMLNEIENYLNGIKYFKANFIQDDIKNSQLCEGEFYLSKPGKLRIDYQNPFEASLYTDARTTIYYDKELDEANSIRTADTPLHFLLKKNISFKSKSFSIVDFMEDSQEVIVSFKEKGKEAQGTLILKFKKSPLTLSSIRITNDSDQDIEMSLFNISTKPIENSIFVFKKPKKQN